MPARPEIIAHRGASHDAPENTLAAVNLAWEMDADAVEIDVHLTSDGRLVVMHDDDTARTTGKPGLINNQTLAELRLLDAGAWMGPQWTGERIPLLKEVLDTVPDGKGLFIELKGGSELVPELQRVLRNMACRVEVISFSIEAVEAAKKAFPRHNAHLLASIPEPDAVNHLIRKAKESGLDGLDLLANELIDIESVSLIRNDGLKLYVWTIDSVEHTRALAALGVDGVTTNRPDLLLRALTSP